MKQTDRKKGSEQAVEKRPFETLEDFLKEELHGFVVGAGMMALSAMLEEERTSACGPRYQQDPQREATRAGYAPGELVLGGRRVAVERPRARTMDGREVQLPSWQRFSNEDPLHRRAVEQMVVGVATRKYSRSLEDTPPGIRVRGASKSAVSRRFVATTRARLAAWLHTSLSGLNLAVLMIDGVHFAEHVVLVALGIDETGKKHVLGLWEGATENATACTALLTNLRERGLRTDRSILVVIDGAKALAKAVREVFGVRALIQRCQVHKKRNVLDQLPEHLRPSVSAAMSEAYLSEDASRAERLLRNLARRLEAEHPGAASSLCEGLDETLTVMRFGLPRPLERTLATTNPIENLVGRSRYLTRNVKRWRGGSMVLRWVAAAVREATKGFRRLRGYAGMPKLVAALTANDVKIDGVDHVKEVA